MYQKAAQPQKTPQNLQGVPPVPKHILQWYKVNVIKIVAAPGNWTTADSLSRIRMFVEFPCAPYAFEIFAYAVALRFMMYTLPDWSQYRHLDYCRGGNTNTRITKDHLHWYSNSCYRYFNTVKELMVQRHILDVDGRLVDEATKAAIVEAAPHRRQSLLYELLLRSVRVVSVMSIF